jgi:hypothetical protein
MSDQHACICEICRAVRRDLGITEKARADRYEKAIKEVLAMIVNENTSFRGTDVLAIDRILSRALGGTR